MVLFEMNVINFPGFLRYIMIKYIDKEYRRVIMTNNHKSYKFLDLFSGAGGFSEGFLQAEYDNKIFDFILASDINSSCEVTHYFRYNRQLGIDLEFLRQDITENDFIENLKLKVENVLNDGETIDVITGGPPCQSFSLAGERRKNDKKDELFSYYLEVIQELKPKYFIMENVLGILTKENGKIKKRILESIRNMIDYKHLEEFYELVVFKMQSSIKNNSSYEQNDLSKYKLQQSLKKINLEFIKDSEKKKNSKAYIKLINMFNSNEELDIFEKEFLKQSLKLNKNKLSNCERYKYFDELINLFTEQTKNNKEIPEDDRNLVKQGLTLLKRIDKLDDIRHSIKVEINENRLNKSEYKEIFDTMTDNLSEEDIIRILNSKLDQIKLTNLTESMKNTINKISLSIDVISTNVIELVENIINLLKENLNPTELTEIIDISNQISLYNIDSEKVLDASNFGVPQVRQRVIFIGCRNDQKLICSIPSTISNEEKVTVFEAIEDLNFIGVGDKKTDYERTVNKVIKNDRNKLIKARNINGKIKPLDNEIAISSNKDGEIKEDKDISNYNTYKTYIEWSKEGRLNPNRFSDLCHLKNQYTVANNIDEINNNNIKILKLANHETSNHNELVQERYKLIKKYGSIEKLREMEPSNNVATTEKRNYTCLPINGQSPTILTIADDFVHYGETENRSLTVREMARLQSFDDSFVFQGKRTTGGDRRKTDIPQYTQVGNAIPPLLAHGIALEILKNIK